MNKSFLLGIALILTSAISLAASPNVKPKDILTNSAHMSQAPNWLTGTRVNQVADRIQNYLEWSIHRVEVYWYASPLEFEKSHSLGPFVRAVSLKKSNSIHLGPLVNSDNFDSIFGHELVHIISFQKFKDAIPAWLEEGLANHIAKNGSVDYKWLAKQKFPEDVRTFEHPALGNKDEIRFHYQVSQALAEMLNAKCDLKNLIRMSVGRDMNDYIATLCNIKDLNKEYQKWIISHK